MSCTENRYDAIGCFTSYEHNIYEAVGKVYDAEMGIDDAKQLYMITWNPDPKELPDIDFITQHEYNVAILADYCKACNVSIFCLEATQKGVPHYHGFYQPSTNNVKEAARIAIIKTMERFGRVKIDKSKGMYKKLNFWTPHANCLYYYKKDLLDAMLGYPNNPITKDSISNIEFQPSMFIKSGKRKTTEQVMESFTLREHYRKFYSRVDVYDNPDPGFI